MEIREYRSGDFKACVELFVRVFNGEPCRDQWTQERASQYLDEAVHRRGFLGYVAVEDASARHGAQAAPQGLIFGHKVVWWNGDQFMIQMMCVETGTQRRGVGSALLKHLKRQLDLKGFMQINLLTRFQEWPASFYRKAGFLESEDLRFFYYFYKARSRVTLQGR